MNTKRYRVQAAECTHIISCTVMFDPEERARVARVN
jgi:hypothetical protein